MNALKLSREQLGRLLHARIDAAMPAMDKCPWEDFSAAERAAICEGAVELYEMGRASASGPLDRHGKPYGSCTVSTNPGANPVCKQCGNRNVEDDRAKWATPVCHGCVP